MSHATQLQIYLWGCLAVNAMAVAVRLYRLGKHHYPVQSSPVSASTDVVVMAISALTVLWVFFLLQGGAQ